MYNKMKRQTTIDRAHNEHAARDLGIEGYTEMSDTELDNAIDRSHNERAARDLGVEGYAEMSDTELQRAVHRARTARQSEVIEPKKPITLTPSSTKEPCPVCLDVIEKAVSTLCNHTFHEVCIQEWAKNSSRCPLCRQSL